MNVMIRFLLDYFSPGLGTVAAIVGIGGGLNSMFGGSSGGGGGGGGGGTGYMPTGLGGADSSFQGLGSHLNELMQNNAGLLVPFLTNAFGNSSDLYGQLGTMMRGWGGTLANQGQHFYDSQRGIEAAGGQLWHDALDPENALHDRVAGQVRDASRASSSARGIAMGAESAGLENQAMSDFGINWTDRQFGREAQGLAGLGDAYRTGGSLGQAGNASLAGAQSMYQGAGMLPFLLSNAYSGSMNQGVYAPYSGLMGNYLQYMGMGPAYSQNAFNQQQTGLNNFTTGMNQLGNNTGWLNSYFSGGGNNQNWTQPPSPEEFTGGDPQPSERSLKKNVKRLGNLKVYSFDYKDKKHGDGKRVGFMADEVEKIFPEAVSRHPDGYRTVDYSMLNDVFGKAA